MKKLWHFFFGDDMNRKTKEKHDAFHCQMNKHHDFYQQFFFLWCVNFIYRQKKDGKFQDVLKIVFVSAFDFSTHSISIKFISETHLPLVFVHPLHSFKSILWWCCCWSFLNKCLINVPPKIIRYIILCYLNESWKEGKKLSVNINLRPHSKPMEI